jgi:hypothetical protein
LADDSLGDQSLQSGSHRNTAQLLNWSIILVGHNNLL